MIDILVKIRFPLFIHRLNNLFFCNLGIILRLFKHHSCHCSFFFIEDIIFQVFGHFHLVLAVYATIWNFGVWHFSFYNQNLIFSAILKELLPKCKDGASSVELCEFGDKRLSEETSKVFKKDKEMKKGKKEIR